MLGYRAGRFLYRVQPDHQVLHKLLQDGTTVWTDSGDLAANLGTITIPSGEVAFYVGADDLPAGSCYVQVVPGTSGIVTAIMHDLVVQRNPKYLQGSQRVVLHVPAARRECQCRRSSTPDRRRRLTRTRLVTRRRTAPTLTRPTTLRRRSGGGGYVTD